MLFVGDGLARHAGSIADAQANLRLRPPTGKAGSAFLALRASSSFRILGRLPRNRDVDSVANGAFCAEPFAA
jgi:hypothetical protein